MQMEASFTAIAIQAAEGNYPEEQLAEQRSMLEATRTLCAAAYSRAFPNALPPKTQRNLSPGGGRVATVA
jgi:hypothetical protein